MIFVSSCVSLGILWNLVLMSSCEYSSSAGVLFLRMVSLCFKLVPPSELLWFPISNVFVFIETSFWSTYTAFSISWCFLHARHWKMILMTLKRFDQYHSFIKRNYTIGCSCFNKDTLYFLSTKCIVFTKRVLIAIHSTLIF